MCHISAQSVFCCSELMVCLMSAMHFSLAPASYVAAMPYTVALRWWSYLWVRNLVSMGSCLTRYVKSVANFHHRVITWLLFVRYLIWHSVALWTIISRLSASLCWPTQISPCLPEAKLFTHWTRAMPVPGMTRSRSMCTLRNTLRYSLLTLYSNHPAWILSILSYSQFS